MKQEEKELLRDLCGRLPYSTIVYAQNSIDWYESELCTQVISDLINEDYIIKPYLFPLSSMTEEQREELVSKHLGYYQIFEGIGRRFFFEKGLAIDATNLNIY